MPPVKGSRQAIDAAKKAAATRLSKNYDAPKKNKFRDEVISAFDPVGTTLALESAQGLFVKAMPEARIYLFESDRATYTALIEANYPNVISVFNSDVSAARMLHEIPFKQGFFDFCNSLDGNIDRIRGLIPIINQMDTVAFTFSQRGTGRAITTRDREYAVHINAMVTKEMPSFDITSCRVYKDTSTMVGVILKRKVKWYGHVFPVGNHADYNIKPLDAFEKTEVIGIVRNWMEGYAMVHWGYPLLGVMSDTDNPDGSGIKILTCGPKKYLVKVGCNIQIGGTDKNPVYIPACSQAVDKFIEVLNALPHDLRDVITTLYREHIKGRKSWSDCLSMQEYILKYIIADDITGDVDGVRVYIASFPEASDAYKKYFMAQADQALTNYLHRVEDMFGKIKKEKQVFEKEKEQWEARRRECDKNNSLGECPEFCQVVRGAMKDLETRHKRECNAFKVAIEALERK